MRTGVWWLVGVVWLVQLAGSTTVEDVTGKQLEAVMQTEDFLAVYWCKSRSGIQNCPL